MLPSPRSLRPRAASGNVAEQGEAPECVVACDECHHCRLDLGGGVEDAAVDGLLLECAEAVDFRLNAMPQWAIWQVKWSEMYCRPLSARTVTPRAASAAIPPMRVPTAWLIGSSAAKPLPSVATWSPTET
jgi:hypothetical protein